LRNLALLLRNVRRCSDLDAAVDRLDKMMLRFTLGDSAYVRRLELTYVREC